MSKSKNKVASTQERLPVVGIGASAGGLKAFGDFFKNMPSESGIAFVLVQHLDPHHESELSELLQNHTAMPVTQLNGNTQVEPNHVYVIPPNKRLSIEEGVLKLSERGKQRGSHAVIDLFFRALASDMGEQAVCIVLSGTGTDGTQGLKAVKEAGGITFAQADAEYEGMPQSAASTGLVDFVLDAAEIPKKLVEVKDHAAQLKLPDGDTSLPEDDSEALRRIFTQLQTRTGHDFSNYKRNTVLRRIGRRMQVHGLSELPAYLSYLREDEGEADALVKELLISVTSFFRDSEAFKVLENKVIPQLFTGDEVRVWVTGCATGEEVYSLAMLLAEHNALRDKPLRVQVFATDINENALEFARRGVYPDTIATDVSPERLERFFEHQGDSYQVKTELRETVLFAVHNLIKDPPFSRLNLVTCRNLLIYLNQEVQEQVYRMFYYALKPDGYLFLGASESLGRSADLFDEVNRKAKLFRHRESAADVGTLFPFRPPATEPPKRDAGPDAKDMSLPALAQRAVLAHHAPAFAVVDEHYNIVYVSGRTGKYLEHPEGEVTNSIIEQAREGLSLDLRTALYRAFRRDSPTLDKPVSVRTNGDVTLVDLSVRRLEGAPKNALVLFRERGEAGEMLRADDDDQQTLAAQLEDELRSTRESLQTTIEELETSNEELRASNEELQSMNEELQSTGEELETSKEELQSTNEELTTVNQELRNKIEELAGVNSDLENLISSTEVGTLFLDASLHLKRYTPAAARVFNLIPADIGRPFAHISHELDVKTLSEDAERVLKTLQPQELEASTETSSYFVRLLPYRTLDNRIDGVIVTLNDVSALKKAEQVATGRARQQETVAELGQYALSGRSLSDLMQEAMGRVAGTLDVDYAKVLENLPEENALLLRAGVGWQEGMVGEAKVGSELDSQAGYTLVSDEAVIVTDLPTETRFSGPALLTNHEVVSGISTIIRGSGAPWGVLGVHSRESRDFTQNDVNFVQSVANLLAEAVRRSQAEAELQEANVALEARVKERTQELRGANARLREQEAFLRSIYDDVSMAVYVIDVEDGFRHVDVNPAFTSMTGVKREQVVGKRPEGLGHLPEAATEAMRKQYEGVAETGEVLEYEVKSSVGGDDAWWLVTLNPVKDEEDRVYRIIGTGLPITDRKQAELEVREARDFAENLIQSSLDGILAFDKDLRYTVFNEGMTRISGVKSEDAVGNLTYEVFPFLEEIGEVDVQRATLRGESSVRVDQPFDVPETGESGFFEAHYAPLKGADGEVVGGLGVVRETTERKQAEDVLRATEERFRAIFEQGPSATCLLILDDWTVVDVNDKCEDVLGYKRGDLRNRSLLELDIWRDPEELRSLETLIDTEDDKRELELHVNRDSENEDGEIGVLCSSLELITFAGKEHVLLIFEDITERKRTEKALREARVKLTDVQDRERLALAHELHDGVIQQLMVINQGLTLLEKQADSDGRSAVVDIGAYRQEVLSLIDGLRRTISNMRPAGLEEFGLKLALESFVGELRTSSGGRPKLSAAIDETDALSPQASRALYRVAQEALRNALKHADADAVRLELKLENGTVLLSVRDDGQGFEPPEQLSSFAQKNHFGLIGMEERVTLLGGSFTVEPVPGRGTTVAARIPLGEQ